MTDRLTDRQTDRQTEFSSLDRVCIACSSVKKLGDYFLTRTVHPRILLLFACLSVFCVTVCVYVCLCTDIEQSFLPWLTDSAVDSLHRQVAVRQVLDDVIRHVMSTRRELMNELEAQFHMIQTGSHDDLVRLTAFMNQAPNFQKILGKILRLA